jgi:hypothetical protein
MTSDVWIKAKFALLFMIVAALLLWAWSLANGQPQSVTMGHFVPPGYSGAPSLAP